MAFGLIFEGEGVTQAQYEQVKDAVAPGNKLPPGMLHHAAGPGERGWTVTEIWESKEAAERFFAEKLGAALQQAGITTQPHFFDVVNLMD